MQLRAASSGNESSWRDAWVSEFVSAQLDKLMHSRLAPYKQHYQNQQQQLYGQTNPSSGSSHLTIGRPLVGIIILASLFLCTLLGALLVILIFCKKRNTVFVLPKQSLSETWRSSIEMNSIKSESLADMSGGGGGGGGGGAGTSSLGAPSGSGVHGDWCLQRCPVSMDTAILLHLLSGGTLPPNRRGADPAPSNHSGGGLPRSASGCGGGLRRSKSCLPPSAVAAGLATRIRSALMPRHSRLLRRFPESRSTYERMWAPPAALEEPLVLANDLAAAGEDHGGGGDCEGCAVSARPWLQQQSPSLNLVSELGVKVTVPGGWDRPRRVVMETAVIINSSADLLA